MNTNNLATTPVPTSLEISLDDGRMMLAVPDLSKPIWFGDYFNGKLGIYEAVVTPTIHGAVTYICTYVNHGGKDFATYCHYQSDTPVEEIVTHLQKNVFAAHQSAAGESDGTFFCDPIGDSTDNKPTIH